jgi:hypothetical protein
LSFDPSVLVDQENNENYLLIQSIPFTLDSHPFAIRANGNWALITCGGIVMKLYRYALFIVIVLLTAYQFAETKVYRQEHVDGMEGPALHARMVLPPNTPVISKAAIYIEKTDRGMYFHSNFISRAPDGTFADNPTKILTTEGSDLLRIFESIVYWGQPITPAREKAALTALNENVVIFIDSNVFEEGGYPNVNVHDAEHVKVLEAKTLFGRSVPAEVLSRESPPPILMSKILDCCLYGIPPHLASSYLKALTSRSFPQTEVRLLSLVRDAATQKAVHQSSTLTRAYIGDFKSPPADLSQIKSAFASAQGKTVVLVSQVDGANFVVRHSAGSATSSIPVKAVRDLAAKYQIQLIDLGCETPRKSSLEDPRIGVATTFNTVDAMKALDIAISQSTDYADFFQALASRQFKVVIDRGFTQGWPLCADIYAQAQNSPTWIKLARVFVSFREKVYGVQNSN